MPLPQTPTPLPPTTAIEQSTTLFAGNSSRSLLYIVTLNYYIIIPNMCHTVFLSHFQQL